MSETDLLIQESYKAIYWKRNLFQKLRADYRQGGDEETHAIILDLWFQKANALLDSKLVSEKARQKLNKDVESLEKQAEKPALFFRTIVDWCNSWQENDTPTVYGPSKKTTHQTFTA